MSTAEIPNHRRRRGSVAGLASATYAAALLGIVTGPLVARYLGPDGRGEFAAVQIYSGFALVVVAVGITQTVNYALQTLKIAPERVLGVVCRCCGLMFVPSVLIAIGVTATVLRDFSDVARVAAVVFIVAAPLGVLQVCLTAFLLAEGALGTLTRVRVLPFVITAAGVVILAVSGQLTLTSYLVVAFASMLAPLLVTVRGVRVRPRGGQPLGPQLRFGLRAYPGSLASLANVQLDQALIAPFLGAANLGIYAVAVSLAQMPLGLSQAVAARGVSEVSLPHGGLDPHLAGGVLRRGVLVTIIFSAGVACAVPLGIPLLYGREFSQAVPLCLVLLLGTVALGVTAIASFCLNLAGKPGQTSVAELISLAATVVGLIVLLPLLGVLGAAIVSTVAYWTRALVQLRALRAAGVRGFIPGPSDMQSLLAAVRGRLRPARD